MLESFWRWEANVCTPNSNVSVSHNTTPTNGRKLRTQADDTGTGSTHQDADEEVMQTEQAETEEKDVQCVIPFKSALTFAQISRNHDVNFYTGLANTDAFLTLFKYVQRKASRMHYWKGLNSTSTDLSSPRKTRNVPPRSLTIEQGFLLTLMRLRLGLLIQD